MIEDHSTALKMGLSAALLVLGLIVAVELPSSAVTGRNISTITQTPPGLLVVSVTLDNGSGYLLPQAGVQVGITQFAFHGLHFGIVTDRSGAAELPLVQGVYGVGVSSSKFAVSTSAQVDAGRITRLHVGVNRTEYIAAFTSVEDSTTQGNIEPWNTIVAEVTSYGLLIVPPLANPGGQVFYLVGHNPQPLATFGPTVFLQTVNYNFVGTPGQANLARGPEVPATVVAQKSTSSLTWLTLRPMEAIQLEGAQYINVVSYQAGSSVSMGNG